MKTYSLIKTFLLLLIITISCQLNAQWTLKGGDINGEAASNNSGFAVSMNADGSIVAIGAPYNNSNTGHVRVYQFNGTAWIQKGSDIDGEATGDLSGYSLSLNPTGSVIAIGAYGNDAGGTDKGHVRIYEFNGSAWVQKGADINGEADWDFSGRSVSINSVGTIVAIGADGNDGSGSNAGHVRVYEYNGTNWIQKGVDINGEAADDSFGFSVKLNSTGLILAVGGHGNDGNGSSAGHVRVFEYSGGAWIQKGSDINGEAAVDYSGYSVSLSSDGSILAVGAYGNDGSGSNAGHVRIFEYSGGTWIQKGSDINGEAIGDQSGYSVSINSDGSVVAIGAWLNDGYAPSAGQTRIYRYNGTSWIKKGQDIDGEAGIDYSGCAVDLNSEGTVVSIGAVGNDGSFSDAGHVRVYKCSSARTLSATACDSYTSPSGNYTWTISGVYLDTIVNAMGCDSCMTINLTVKNSSSSSLIVSSCDSYLSPGGKTFTVSGVYKDTIPNSVNCDSVITINLTVKHSTTSSFSQTVCGTYTSPGGKIWTSSGIYKDTIPNAANCDSVMTINLTVYPEFNIAENASICSGDNYTFPDGTTQNNITAQVIHTSNLQSIHFCDSVIQTTVNVYPVYNLSENFSICSGDNYTFPDGTTQNNITAQVVHTSNLQSIHFCDSVIQTTVNVYPVYNLSENFSICSGDNYTFPDGTTQTNITAQVIHTSNLQSIHFCDSVIQTTVNVYPVYNLSENFSICSGDNYTFPDGTTQNNITAQVIHTSNLQSIHFCDSVIQTTVNVYPVYNLSENFSICSGDNFTFPDGTTQTNITAQVIHTSNLQSVLFCDSVIQTTVNVNPVYSTSENVSICSGDDFTFPDGTTQTNITAQVIHTSNLQSIHFCDSVIQTTVDVNPVYSLSENFSICSGGDYTFPDGTTQTNITAQVVHTSNLQSVFFCDSVIQTTVEVINVDTSVSQNTGVLTANTTGAAYQWLYCDSSFSEVTGETNQSFTAIVSGNYAVEITENSCADTSYCFNVIVVGTPVMSAGNDIYIFPNPSTGKIYVIAEDILLIEIYNNPGQIIRKSEKSGEINLCNESSGIYYIKVVTGKKSITQKIIKE